MAAASNAGTIEADNAASDAAREARDEVIKKTPKAAAPVEKYTNRRSRPTGADWRR